MNECFMFIFVSLFQYNLSWSFTYYGFGQMCWTIGGNFFCLDGALLVVSIKNERLNESE